MAGFARWALLGAKEKFAPVPGATIGTGASLSGAEPHDMFRPTRSVDGLHCDKSQAVLLTGTALPQPRTKGVSAVMTRITMDRGRPIGGGFPRESAWPGAASPRQATWARHLAARDPAMVALVALTVATVTIARSATRPKTTAGRTTSALLCGVKRCRARDGEAPRERHFGQSMKLLAHQLPQRAEAHERVSYVTVVAENCIGGVIARHRQHPDIEPRQDEQNQRRKIDEPHAVPYAAARYSIELRRLRELPNPLAFSF